VKMDPEHTFTLGVKCVLLVHVWEF